MEASAELRVVAVTQLGGPYKECSLEAVEEAMEEAVEEAVVEAVEEAMGRKRPRQGSRADAGPRGAKRRPAIPRPAVVSTNALHIVR